MHLQLKIVFIGKQLDLSHRHIVEKTYVYPTVIVKFLQDKKKYRKRRAKISADISARLFRVTCDKVSGILIHKNLIVDVKSWT